MVSEAGHWCDCAPHRCSLCLAPCWSLVKICSVLPFFFKSYQSYGMYNCQWQARLETGASVFSQGYSLSLFIALGSGENVLGVLCCLRKELQVIREGGKVLPTVSFRGSKGTNSVLPFLKELRVIRDVSGKQGWKLVRMSFLRVLLGAGENVLGVLYCLRKGLQVIRQGGKVLPTVSFRGSKSEGSTSYFFCGSWDKWLISDQQGSGAGDWCKSVLVNMKLCYALLCGLGYIFLSVAEFSLCILPHAVESGEKVLRAKRNMVHSGEQKKNKKNVRMCFL